MVELCLFVVVDGRDYLKRVNSPGVPRIGDRVSVNYGAGWKCSDVCWCVTDAAYDGVPTVDVYLEIPHQYNERYLRSHGWEGF